MLFIFLKRFTLLIFFCICILYGKAQQAHFIYLQTENNGPFYIKLNNKVISSSSSGYLIIPQLADSDYNVAIGFPKKEFPEQNFLLKVQGIDEGYLLKNFNDHGWGLFNLESFAVTMADGKGSQTIASANIQSDPFSKMLATVTGDSTILQKNESSLHKNSSVKDIVTDVKKDSVAGDLAMSNSSDSSVRDSSVLPVKDSLNLPIKDSVSFLAKTDSLKKISPEKDSLRTIETPVATNVEPLLLSPATRISRRKTKEGIRLIYVDYNMDKDDTIKVFMPYEKESITNAVEKKNKNIVDSIKTNNASSDSAVVNQTLSVSAVPADTTLIKNTGDSIGNNKSAKDTTEILTVQNLSDTCNKISTTNTTKIDKAELPQIIASSGNSDCKAFASNEDFLKLRKKMAGESNNDDMIKVAKKVFHSRCFSTEQIKNLSFLFLSDEGKYMFFETAYPFTSDSNQFSSLQSQISDNYYGNRFKAMINK